MTKNYSYEFPKDYHNSQQPQLDSQSRQTELSGLAAQRFNAQSPEELLAYIYATLGFEPRESMILVAFANDALSSVVRCDIPDFVQQMLRTDTSESVTFMDLGITESQRHDLRGLGKHLHMLLSQEQTTTSVMVIYTSDEVQVSDQTALAIMGSVNQVLAEEFELGLCPMRESWLMHHDMLWHLRCAANLECDVQAVAVENPYETRLYQQLAATSEGKTPHTSQRPSLSFPPIPRQHVRKSENSCDVLNEMPVTVMKWLDEWDVHLNSAPSMLHTNQLNPLLDSIEYPIIREIVIAMACFDQPTALQGMVALGRFPEKFVSTTGIEANQIDGLIVKSCLEARSNRSPRWDRIAALEHICKRMLPLSNEESGGSLAGILFWIEWVRGRGSLALELLEQAIERFPGETYLHDLEETLRQGNVAQWATKVESAWTPRHAA